jgi:hypothetical protein
MHFGKSKKSKDTTKSTANQPAEFLNYLAGWKTPYPLLSLCFSPVLF